MSVVIDMKATGENIRRLLQEKNISATELQSRMNLASVQSVYHWLIGRSLPTVDHLVEMAAVFGVTVDEILVVKCAGGACTNGRDDSLWKS